MKNGVRFFNMVYTYKKNDAGLYVCEICGVTKKNQNTMHYHRKRHEGKKEHACELCNESFYQKIELQNHIAIQHTKEEPKHSCPFACTHRFHTKGQCQIHIMRTHLQDFTKQYLQETDTFSCTACNKQCNSRASILYHLFTHAKADTRYTDLCKDL
jgi:hypothetical protein